MSRTRMPPPSITSWRRRPADWSALSGARWRRARSVPVTGGSPVRPSVRSSSRTGCSCSGASTWCTRSTRPNPRARPWSACIRYITGHVRCTVRSAQPSTSPPSFSYDRRPARAEPHRLRLGEALTKVSFFLCRQASREKYALLENLLDARDSRAEARVSDSRRTAGPSRRPLQTAGSRRSRRSRRTDPLSALRQASID